MVLIHFRVSFHDPLNLLSFFGILKLGITIVAFITWIIV